MELSQQYCLKWNNHPTNISGVFHRLRSKEQFVDVSLSSTEGRVIKCHKILLSAGSGYLEDILEANPSDHPTIVLSQIRHSELKLLVEFMYAGEIAVEQDKLPTLLEAARILKIRGLWDSEDGKSFLESNANSLQSQQAKNDSEVWDTKEKQEKERTSREPLNIPHIRSSLDSFLSERILQNNAKSQNEAVSNIPSQNALSGSQKRKRKTLSHDEMSADKVYTPMFGVSNAYFLTNNDTNSKLEPAKLSVEPTKKRKSSTSSGDSIPTLMTVKDSPKKQPQVPPPLSKTKTKDEVPNLPEIMNLLSRAKEMQTGKDSEAKQENSNNATSFNFGNGLLASTPVRRYKQYTEESLQKALKDIIDGQSINRSSNKYNIPARTLRDWMKRLNIRSAFTQSTPTSEGPASQNKAAKSTRGSTSSDETSSLGSSCDTNDQNSLQQEAKIKKETSDEAKLNQNAFPGMNPDNGGSSKLKKEEEEEIDDEEESVTKKE